MAERMRLDLRKPGRVRSQLHSREVLLDVSHVMAAIEDAYAARPWVPTEDMLLVRFALRTLLKSRSGWETRAFCEQLDRALMLLPDDQFYAALEGEPCAPPRRERLETSVGAVGKNVLTRADQAWLLTGVETAAGEVPVLALRRFPSPDLVDWESLLDRVAEVASDANSELVIDLRENWGGHETGAEKLAAALVGHRVDRSTGTHGNVQLVRNMKPQAAVARMNLVWEQAQAAGLKMEASHEMTPNATRTPAHQEAWLASFANEPAARQSNVDPSVASPRIFVMVDRVCAGVCERFVMLLRRASNVIVVGESTAGRSSLLEFGLVRLPGSNIEIRVPTAVLLMEGQKFLGSDGLPADIPVAPNHDALRVVQDRISSYTR